MKISIIGFMGSGKSTVSALLAEKLGYPCIEIDHEIVALAGGKSIPQLFEQGEEIFRNFESEAVQRASTNSSVVISAGGGTPLRGENVKALRSGDSLIIYLSAQFETIRNRIGSNSERPLFRDQEKARELFEARQTIYRTCADYIVCAEQSPDEICAEIIDLVDEWRGKEPSPKKCMVIGDPIAHSLSPRMHSAAYQALRIDQQFSYQHMLVPAAELPVFISKFRSAPNLGASCTMPHKESLVSLVDSLDPMAEKIGAVNTLKRNGHKITGFNTDWLGIITPLTALTPLNGKSALVVGAGGAARAAICGLKASGVRVSVTNRTESKAAELAGRFSIALLPWSERLKSGSWDIIINTTSVGMGSPDGGSPLSGYPFSPSQIIFETIYHPRDTQLLKDARAAGARTIEGREMLLYQGVAQFELFTNRKAPVEQMRAALD